MIDSPQILTPPTARAITAMVVLGANALLLVACGALTLWTLVVLEADGATRQVVDLWDGIGLVLAVETFLLMLVGAVTVIMWLWAARNNALRLGEDSPDWGRPWIILGWFVPIMNLWVPCRIVKQVWQASTPGGDGTWPVNLWWTFWLGYLLSSRLAEAGGMETVGELRSSLIFTTAACAAGVAAAALLAFVIWRITGFQRVQAGKWAAALDPAHPPVRSA